MRDILLLAHFTGLIIGAGSAFAVFVIGYLSASFNAAYKREVLLKLFPLRYISYVGLLLLIGSGVFLMAPYWAKLEDSPVLIAKLVFVAIIAALSVFGALQMHRARQSADNDAFKLLSYAGKMSFASSLIVVTCAVYTFH